MFCRGIESYGFWCSTAGKNLSYFIVIALVLFLLAQVYKAWKKWNEPRDMSKFSQAPGTFSSVSVPDESEETGATEEETEDEEDDSFQTDEEEKVEEEVFDIDAAFENWQEENNLPDLTNASVIGEFFGFNKDQEITIVGYDPENKEFLISVVLVTGEIISFYFPGELIDFEKSDQSMVLMNVLFEESFLESEFTWDDAESIKESLAKIDWNSNIFTEENCKKIKIHLTKAAHTKALRTKI